MTLTLKLTRDEFLKKYGHVKVKFKSYYKYSFTYEATLPDGNDLVCTYGGGVDDIYRHSVDADCEETVSDLQPYSAYVYQGDKAVEGF